LYLYDKGVDRLQLDALRALQDLGPKAEGAIRELMRSVSTLAVITC